MIEITEHKLEEMSECVEKMLRYGGKLMSCIDEMQRGGGRMGEREPMDYRMGSRMGYRDDEDEMGERGGYGERRGVRGTGRYSRY